MAINIFVMAYDQSENDFRYKKGYIAHVEDDSIPISKRMCLPQFIVFNVSGDITVDQAKAYMEEWQQSIAFTQVAHQTSTDGFRVRLYVENASTSGVGNVTRTQVENYLNRWGATVHSVATNEVTFDFYIYDVIKSKGFWNVDNIDDIDWAEVYTESTGNHRVTVDYSAYGWNPDNVERRVNEIIDPEYDDVHEDDGIVSHDKTNKILVIDINRDTVLRAFKQSIKEKSESKLNRRYYYIDNSYCNTAINSMERSNIQSGSGDTFVVADASGFSVNDKVSVVDRDNVKDFELATISGINSNTITLDTTTTGDYSSNSLITQRECVIEVTKAELLAELKSKIDE